MVNIDVIIVGVFLVITLVLGILCGKGIKTFKDYAVGNKSFSTWTLTISFIATVYSGVRIESGLDYIYRDGLRAFIASIAPVMTYYFTARFFVVRMKEFISDLSIAESMGKIYGTTVRTIVALFGIMESVSTLAAQFIIGLRIITFIYPEPFATKFSNSVAILIGIIVVVYSTCGGARSVAFTDIFQFLFFGLSLPLLIFMLLYYTKDPFIGCSSLTQLPSFSFESLCVWDKRLKALIGLLLYRFIIRFTPSRVQRIYMAKSIFQAKKMFIRSAIASLILGILFLLVAIVLHFGGHQLTAKQHVLDYMVSLAYFPGLKGIIAVSIISFLMATADSNLHAASVIFVNDLIPVVSKKIRSIYNISQLQMARISSVMIGMASLILGLYTTDALQLVRKSMEVYSAAIVLPFIVTIMGFRPRAKALLITIFITTVITLYHIYTVKHITNSELLYSMVVSFSILVFTHYLLPKHPNRGWVGVKDRSLIDLQDQETKRWWCTYWQNIKILFTNGYLAKNFPKKSTTFILLGIYLVVSTLVALWWIESIYFFPYIYWYIAVMVIGMILFSYPFSHAYKPRGNQLFHILWPVILWGVLFVSGIQFAVLGRFMPMVCLLYICNLAIASILLPLKFVIALFLLAITGYKLMPLHLSFWNTVSNSWALSAEAPVCIVFMLSIIAVTTLYVYMRNKAAIKLSIIELAYAYERKASLEAIYNQTKLSRIDPTYGGSLLQEMRKLLEKPCEYLYTHGQEALGSDVNIFMKKLSEFRKLLLERAKEERNLELNVKAVELVEIKATIEQVYRKIRNLEVPMQLLLYNQTATTQLLADPALFERWLTINLFEISTNEQATDGIVTLTIADTVLRYDNASMISFGKTALSLQALAFFISTDITRQTALLQYNMTDDNANMDLPKREKQLYQVAESRQIIYAHGGYSKIVESDTALTCLYVLPINGKNVMRFKSYDPAMLCNQVAETAKSCTQEKELVKLLTKHTPLTREKVESTIAFMKNAHGLVLRKSGDPYYTHPMAVAAILLDVTQDPDTILAGLLHDIVEDTPVTLTQIELMYGSSVSSIIDLVTHYTTHGYRWKLGEAENRDILGQSKDIRVVQVKLADRLHNIRTLYARTLVDQKRIVQETIDFYIPWGKKNNISTWLSEMSAICNDILGQKK